MLLPSMKALIIELEDNECIIHHVYYSMLPAEKALSFSKQNLHASLILFWSLEYIERNTNSRATISPQNMNLLRHLGMFTFENYCPKSELCWDKHFRFCFIPFLGFLP